MPILKKVPSYVKNVAKSVAYSAVDVAKTEMPTVSAFLDNESNKEVGKIVYDNIKDLQSIRLLGRNTAIALRRSKVWEAGELGIKSAMEDIRSGKWYNKERISMIEEQVLEETMGGWDDMDLDMESMEFGATDEPTKGDKLISASVQIAVGKSADQISETTINAASAIMNQQKQSTELMYAQNFKLASEIRATVTNIGNKTNTYLDNIQNVNKTMAENNRKFFDVATKLMQDNNAMMKEMIAMQRNLYRNQQEIEKQREKERSKQKPGYNDFVSMEGVLDIKEYGKYVKGNTFKVLDEQSGGMLSMLFGGADGSGKGNLLKTFASSPLSFMSNWMMSQMLPKNIKRSSNRLDSTLAGVVPTLLGNLNKTGKNSENPLAQIVGKILGVDTRVQTKIDTGKYEKGPMQYNGKANKSLTEVIPELLSDILSTLSGSPKKLYDFDKGRWTTGRAVKKEFDQMTKNNMRSSFSDLLSEMRDYTGGGKGPKFSSRQEAERFQQTLESFLTVLYNNDGSFNARKDYEMYQMAGISKSDYDMIAKMIQNIGKRNHSVRMGLSASVMGNKQALNSQMKSLQEKGGIFNYLFNGTDSNKLYKTPKYEDEPVRIGSDLNKTLDNKGNNVFYYLQNIYDEMYRIRMFGFGINGGSGWKTGNAAGKPFNESIYNISRIENNHKQNAKEKYAAKSQSEDARYREMIEKFTAKGGQLYDLVDDKGNINLINATAEQKRIADMIEQARTSGGFLQDTLFGDSSALDRDNAKRAKKDESQINAKKFLDRLKQSKTLEDKFKVLSDQAKRGTRGSANITANIITRADDAIYEFFFGDETGEEDENNKTIKGFMNLMKNKLNNALDKGLGFIDEKILAPIKKKTGADSLRDWFLEKTGIKGLFESAKHWLLGDEGQKNGFLHTLGEETKNLFGKAGSFVGNSFKTVFSPVTDRVKSGWQKLNQPSETVREIDMDELTGDSGSVSTQTIIRDSLSRKNSFEKSLIVFRGLKNAQLIAEELSKNSTDIDTVNKAISYVNKLQKEYGDDRKYKKRFDVVRKGLLNRKRELSKEIGDRGGRISALVPLKDGDTLESSIQNSIARSQELLYSNHDKYAKKYRGENFANSSVFNEKIQKFASNFLSKLKISTNYVNVLVGVLSDYVYQEADAKKTEARLQKMSTLTASEICSRLSALGTNRALALNQLIESAIINKNSNMDSTLGELHNRGLSSSNEEMPAGNRSLLGETMIKFYDLINSIIDHTSNAIRIVPTRIRTNTRPLGGDINSRGSRGRESETEGRSSDSDGGIAGAAHGAVFNQGGISALSEGEIYGNNGLYGKVPKTGVYSVKAGTTIIPTKKDKAIEVAKEQDVINKAIYSNANAQGQRTLQYNGHTYTELEPGKWTAYWQDDKGKSFKDVRTEDQFNLVFRTKQTAKAGAQSVIDGLGLNSQLGSVTMPKNLEEAKALITKYAPKLGAGAILGGAIGLLAGNPILGAAIGGTASVVSVSEQAKTFLFGEKLHDEEGNETGRAGGLVSAGAQDAIKKYFPSMAKYGTVGATLGLLSPFGLVGGALIGSSIGWANSNDAIREALFGKSDDPKSGLMSEETRKKLKKAMPNMIVGAGLGLVTGPFGILGNALLGSGLGLVSTTNGFKDFVFGTEYTNPDGTISREGGLMGSIRKHVVDPLKDFGLFFKNKMEDMFINGIINPIKESIKPLTKDFYLLAKNALGLFPNMVNAMFDSTFGRPLTQLIDEKLISPIANVTGKMARGVVGLGAGIVSSPFKALRGVARSRQMSHIKTGNADYMTAADRLQFRKDHKVRSLGGDSYESTDEVMNLMNKDELKENLSSMKVLQNVGKLRKDEKAAGRALSAEVTKYFGTKGATWKKFKAAMESNSIEQFSTLLDTTPMINGEMMSQQQKDALIQLANTKLEAVAVSRQKQNLTKDKEKELFRSLKEKGFNVTTKNVDKISAMLQNEYSIKSKAEKQLTPEEQAANAVNDVARKNTEDIITTLKDSTKVIADILANNAPNTEAREANKKFVEDYLAGPTVDPETGEEQSREERRKKELEAAQLKARSGLQKAKDKGAGWWNKLYGSARQHADSLANPDAILEDQDESNSPSLIARALGVTLNTKDKAASKLNTIYNKGKKAFGEELDTVKKQTKEVFDPAANRFRSFRRGMNGEWVENSGKAQTTADKAEAQAQQDQMNKLGMTIGSAIGKVFGTSDKETGEEKEGLLSKLFGKVKGPLGKLVKGLGMGLLGATVVAGVGHASESLFPKIEDIWTNKIKPWMNTTFDGLGDKLVKIKDGIVQIPGKLFDWATGTGRSKGGGLPSLFRDKIFPWFLDGFGAFATTFLPPIVETIVKALPAIVKGIGKGIMGGLKAIFFKDDKYHSDFDKMKVDTKVSSKAYSSKSNLSSVPGNGWWKSGSSSTDSFDSMLSSLDGIMSGGASGIQGKTESQRKEDQESYQAIINDPNATEAQKQQAAASAAANAAEYGPNGEILYDYRRMLKDSKGNTIDANGNYTNDNSNAVFDPFGGAASLQDRMFKGGIRRILTPGASNLPLKALSATGQLLTKMPGHGLLSMGTRGVGRVVRGAGNAGQAITRVSDRVMGGVLTGNVGDIAYRMGSRGNFARTGADAVTQKALQRSAAKGALNVGEEIVSETGSKFVVKQTERGAAQVVRSSVGEATEEVASRGLAGKLSRFIKKGLDGIFQSKFVQDTIIGAAASSGRKLTTKAIKKVADTVVGKLIRKAVDSLKTAAVAVITRVSTSLSTAQIASVAFAAWDFVTGTKNARSILGLTKNQDISWVERIIAGFLKCMNGFLTWGLIPESFIVDLFIEHLAPIIGVDTEDLQKRREEAAAEVTAHNDAMGTNYDIEEYNNRNSLGTKISKGLKGLIGKSDENTVAEHNAIYGTNLTLEEYEAQYTFGGKAKTLGSNAIKAVKSGVGAAAKGIANTASGVLDKLKTNIGYVASGDIINLVKSIGSIRSEEGNVDASEMIGSTITAAAMPIIGPPTLMIGAVKGIGKGISTVVKTLQQEGPNILSKLKQSFTYMKSGDPVGLVSSLGDIRTEDNSLSIGKLIGSIATGASLPFTFVPTAAIGAVKLLGKGISAVAQGIVTEGPRALEKVKETGNFIASGDVVGLVSSIGSIRTEEGDISIGRILGSALTGATLPLTIVPTAVIGAGKLVGNFIGKVVTAVGNTKELMDKNSSAIKELALKGELKQMFSFEVDKGEENPLGFLQTGIGLANKLMMAPTAAFHALGNGINKLLGTGKDDDNKMVKISDVINEMKDYMDTDKHKTMDGWDSVGSKYTNATGPVGIINRLIVNSVKGVGKHVVNIVRAFGGIIDLINKIPGVEIGGGSTESGTGKYGLGRVSQLDPRVAKTPFNSPSDSRKQTIGNSGCGPAAAVNAVNYAYGTGPDELLNASKYALRGGWKERDGGTKPGFFSSYLGSRGLKASHIGSSSVARSLESGSPVILMGKDASGGNTPYGPNPHYVVAKGLDRNGNMIIDDPESLAPSMTYPAGKVLGKTSMAIKASRYGTAGDTYLLIGVYKNGSRTPTMINPNLYISKSDVYTNYNMPRDEQCHPVMLKHDTRSMFYMRDSVLKRIGVLTDATSYIPQGSTLTSSTNAGRTSISSGGELAKAQQAATKKNTTTTSVLGVKVNEKDGNKTVFSAIGWLDIPYKSMLLKGDTEAIGNIDMLCRKYKITIKASDHTKTVRNILQSYFRIYSISTLENFAKQIAKYSGITCAELRDKNSSLYSSLKSYAKINQTRMDDDWTVARACELLSLRFAGDKPETAKYAGSDSTVTAAGVPENGSVPAEYYTDGSTGSYGSETQKEQPTSFFDMLKSSFMSMFNYTDKSGQQKNLLSIFGIGDSGSSTGGSYSTGGTNIAGLSPQQSAVKKAISSIMGKNKYNQGARNRVDATLKGESMGSADCSSTTQWALKTGANVDPGGNTHAQIQSPNGQWVDGPYEFASAGSATPSQSKLALGDLMFYGTNGSSNKNHVSHVEMYWGDSQRVGHGSGMGPKVSAYTAKSSSQRYLGAKRFMPVGSVLSSSSPIMGSASSLGNPAPGDTETTKQVIWKFLKGKGYNDIAAAGIMGNIAQECGFNYAIIEGGGKGPGVGICQWTYPSRKRAFLAAVPDWQTNLPGQLDFMWSEINSGYKKVLPAELNKCATVTDAVWKFHQVYEGSADIQRTGGLVKRENYGAQAYSQFANTSLGTTYATGKYGLGVVDGQITSGFNDPTRASHSGIDIAASRGTPVKSPVSGIVIRAEENAENGKMIVIRDNNGRLYTFTHLQDYGVKVGSRVAPNTIIGSVGSTGNSSGNHLHYQMTDTEGQFVDPVAYAMGKKTAPASKDTSRAIGGSNGIDYTSLITNIIQLLAIIGTNTEKINALVEAMAKMGVDTTGIDTTSNESKINAIKSSITNGLNRSQQASKVTTEIESQRLEKMMSTMRNIAAQ